MEELMAEGSNHPDSPKDTGVFSDGVAGLPSAPSHRLLKAMQASHWVMPAVMRQALAHQLRQAVERARATAAPGLIVETCDRDGRCNKTLDPA